MNQNGSYIIAMQGETIPISTKVTNVDGSDATNLQLAKMYIYHNGTKTTKSMNIVEPNVSYTFEQADTLLMEGLYVIDIRVKSDAGEVYPPKILIIDIIAGVCAESL